MTDRGEVVLVEAARVDIALVNEMARFYLYDIARQIGPNDEWVASSDWMRERKDFSGAWDEGNHPFLIEVGGALAGFCLVDRYALVPDIDWKLSPAWLRTRAAVIGELGNRVNRIAGPPRTLHHPPGRTLFEPTTTGHPGPTGNAGTEDHPSRQNRHVPHSSDSTISLSTKLLNRTHQP